MNRIYYGLFEKIYRYFYFYCLSGQDEDHELLLKAENDIQKAGDNTLIYLFQMMQYADGMNRDDSWNIFQEKKDELKNLLKKDFDTWCYHQVLFLVYTYIYPDMEEAAVHNRLSNTYKEKLAGGEVEMTARLLEFDREDYEIQKHFDNDFTMMEAYKMRFSERDFRMQKRSFLMILKGFSSSTPFFYPALEHRFYQSPIKGGGIFIKWHGYGIVIDPGINFMENMHLNNLGIRDINAVIVTHDHIDHNGDLQVIDDLAYATKQEIVYYVDPGTNCKLKNFANMKKRYELGQKSNHTYSLEEIKIQYMGTRHITDSQNPGKYKEGQSFALKIFLLSGGNTEHIIGITSDTEYFPELGEFMYGCDFVIANMSEPKKNDYKKSITKKKHLGYNGCFRLIQSSRKNNAENLHPHYVISEFWAGKGDARRELVKKLREETEYSRIYPGDIGMTFFLDRSSFLCAYCGCETNIDGLHLIREKNEYGKISLICDSCLLI